MTASEIVKVFLKANGYDGLCNEWGGCGCGLDDFAPCSEPSFRCEAAYRWTCSGGSPEDKGCNPECGGGDVGSVCYRTIKPPVVPMPGQLRIEDGHD